MAFLQNTPQVTRNLIFVNVLMYFATVLGERSLNSVGMSWFVLYPPGDYFYRPWQFVTYMFMHGGFFHILFNMYCLWIFGSMVERIIGSRKFGMLYFLCGIGAAVFHLLLTSLFRGINCPMLGASGAVYGVMVAYAMLFPTSRLTLLFPPVTLDAKWMVIIFAGIELVFGVLGTREGIAHFAHLGGMIVGFLLMYLWKSQGRLFTKRWW